MHAQGGGAAGGHPEGDGRRRFLRRDHGQRGTGSGGSTAGGTSSGTTGSGGATTGGSTGSTGGSTGSSGGSGTSGGSGGSGGDPDGTAYKGKQVQVPYACKTPIGDKKATSPVQIDGVKKGGGYDLTVHFAKSVMDSPADIPKGSVKPSMDVKVGGADKGSVKVEGPTNAQPIKSGQPIEIPDLKGTYKPGASGKATLTPGVLTVNASAPPPPAPRRRTPGPRSCSTPRPSPAAPRAAPPAGRPAAAARPGRAVRPAAAAAPAASPRPARTTTAR